MAERAESDLLPCLQHSRRTAYLPSSLLLLALRPLLRVASLSRSLASSPFSNPPRKVAVALLPFA